MDGDKRARRDEEIVRLYLAGNRPSYIASLYQMGSVRIRRILREHGIELDDPKSVWDLPNNERRDAIWERQREGAREALRMAVIPAIHETAHAG